MIPARAVVLVTVLILPAPFGAQAADLVHRVAADGVSPEQAVDEAITRIKQILAE
jgi:hypothetical protein